MTETSQQRTAVLVLRSGHHGGLGIVRSLGRLGVPVYCVDATWWESASPPMPGFGPELGASRT